MQCVKTGAHIYLEQYGLWAICDAFEVGGVYLFRIAGTSFEPMNTVKHYVVTASDQWFDRNRSDGGSSTMIARFVMGYGYEGAAI